MRTKRAGQSALLLLDAVEVLEREKVDYAVIGAFALSAHGVVRASTDVDVLVFATPKQLAMLRARFQRACQADLGAIPAVSFAQWQRVEPRSHLLARSDV